MMGWQRTLTLLPCLVWVFSTQADEHLPPVCGKTVTAEAPWYDKAHLLLSEKLCNQAVWFDNFFGEPNGNEVATSLIKFRLQQQYDHYDGYDLKPRVYARVKLPNLSDKLELTFFGRDDEPDGSELSEPRGSDERSSAALRYRFWEDERVDLDLDAGIKFRSGVDGFTKAKGRFRDTIASNKVLTFTQELMWEHSENWSETTRLRMDFIFDRQALRWDSRLKYGEETLGGEWRSQLALARQINSHTAIAYFTEYSGATDEDPDDKDREQLSLGVSFRQTVFRRWFFYDVQPELILPKEYDYDPGFRFTLGLEVQFGAYKH